MAKNRVTSHVFPPSTTVTMHASRRNKRPYKGRSLPLEAIDCILSQFRGKIRADGWVLKRCALVCKAWTPIARKHLFAILRVKIPDAPARAKFISTTLPLLPASASPYAIECRLCYPHAKREEEAMLAFVKRLVDEGKLLQLRTLTLSHMPLWSARLVSTLFTTITALNFDNVEVHGDPTLYECINACAQSAEKMQVCSTMFHEQCLDMNSEGNLVAAFAPPGGPQVALQSLSIEAIGTSGLVEWLAWSPTVRTLRSLHVSLCGDEDAHALAHLMAAPDSALTHLDIEFTAPMFEGMHNVIAFEYSSHLVSAIRPIRSASLRVLTLDCGSSRSEEPAAYTILAALDTPALERIILSIARGRGTRASKKLSLAPFDLTRPGLAGLREVEVWFRGKAVPKPGKTHTTAVTDTGFDRHLRFHHPLRRAVP
jgi:hypothetical protein